MSLNSFKDTGIVLTLLFLASWALKMYWDNMFTSVLFVCVWILVLFNICKFAWEVVKWKRKLNCQLGKSK